MLAGGHLVCIIERKTEREDRMIIILNNNFEYNLKKLDKIYRNRQVLVRPILPTMSLLASFLVRCKSRGIESTSFKLV